MYSLKKGFFLIELLIYLFVLSLIVSLFYPIVMNHILAMRNHSISNDAQLEYFAALDVLALRIAKAPSNAKNWSQKDGTTLSWKDENSTILYYLDGEILKYREQHKDVTHRHWKKATTAVLAQKISAIQFKPIIIDNEVKQVIITLEGNKNVLPYSLNRIVKVKSGILS